MKILSHIYPLILIAFVALTAGCIHEYPHPISPSSPEKGENPTVVNLFLDIKYDIDEYENINTWISSRARTDRPHRFIIEVFHNDESICRDEINLSDEEYSLGYLRHKISKPLNAMDYAVTIWSDMQNETGDYSFDASDPSNVYLINLSTTNATVLQCECVKEILDLREYTYPENTEGVVKEVSLSRPGAIFEIIATDVQDFITSQKNALNQGEKYTIHLEFAGNRYQIFDSLNEIPVYSDERFELSGRMRLPFAEYDELKIAEGFLFCNSEEEVSMRLYVTNTALVTVAETDYFSFKVKRGFKTIVSGDFLSNLVDGIFSIDNIWKGEMVQEIE